VVEVDDSECVAMTESQVDMQGADDMLDQT
jgi:hypothetical protein